jgi:hypothetical protein
MSLQEKVAWDKRQKMVTVARKAIVAGYKDFNAVKVFLISNNLVPDGVDVSRYAACILQIIKGG